jgi:hypothetical protein
MDESKWPVTGYLLIKTKSFPERIYPSKDECDDRYNDPLERIACKINEILMDYQKNGKGAVEGPFRGAIVSSDEPDLNIIISFRAKDEDTFIKIQKEIMQLSAYSNSEEAVTGVTKAIRANVPYGFQGPP